MFNMLITLRTISSVFRLLNWSNCCWVIGGKTAFNGRWDGEWWCGVDGCEISAFVIEAILCSGLTAADGEKSSGGSIEFPKGELAELPAETWPIPEKEKIKYSIFLTYKFFKLIMIYNILMIYDN